MRRLALLCAGLDSVRRGYEVHVRRLFDHLRNDLPPGWEVLLVKRDGVRRPNEIVLRVPSRSSLVVRFLARFRGDCLYWESVLFAVVFVLRMFWKQERVDRIYAPEPAVVRLLARLRFLLRGRPQILFMHGVWMEPEQYVAYADRIQEVGIANYARSRSFAPGKPIVLIPHFDREEGPAGSPHDFRRRHGLADRPVLLNVGIVGRVHKRTDHLLREAVRLPPEWSVVVCGGVEDPTVLEEGRTLLGGRLLHLDLPPEEMGGAYGSATLFVHCALTEGFGIVILEAMKSGLPLLVHDGELFRWIVKDDEQCIDMTAPGNLGRNLALLAADPSLRAERGRRNRETFLHHYTWRAVRESYRRFLFEGVS